MLTTRQRIALSNARKFTSPATAQRVAIEQKYWVSVLLGDNGQFWVASNQRETSILVKLGYEEVSKETLTFA